MLANGRKAMVQRAVRSFITQSYAESYRALLILETSPRGPDSAAWADVLGTFPGVNVIQRSELHRLTIGTLRNEAGRCTCADIIIHWDSDDWSHPQRIAEQVSRLEASGNEAVGYRDMLFWRTSPPVEQGYPTSIDDAWLYTNRNPQYCLGTSLCYWREVWQRNPFPDTSAGEDTLWLRTIRSEGQPFRPYFEAGKFCEPRMIASIHGGNTYAKIDPHAEEWRRVPEWDAHCREMMAL